MRTNSNMPFLFFLLITGVVIWTSCQQDVSKGMVTLQTQPVRIAGAMKNVMWNGELGGVIQFDSLQEKGLYGIGPLEGLGGEVLIVDGIPYVSRVGNDSILSVGVEATASAPFLVYGVVADWKQVEMPDTILTVPQLENWLSSTTSGRTTAPFAFRLHGTAVFADYHVQNLPPGRVVSSPAEAHSGQVNYLARNEEVDLVGFYSTQHQGIFTHHDTYVHIHMISADRTKMGHLDDVRWEAGSMDLFLPTSLIN